MQLVKLHINGFGCLVNFTMDFQAGINVFTQHNGFGKTTLAHFVQAMFYGLKANRKQNLDENLKEKYKPWKSALFGGALTFSFEGKLYRIERDFNKNTMTVFDCQTEKPTMKFGENVGQAVFGVDAEAFSMVTYLPQKNVFFKMNDSLSSKLSGLKHDTDSKINYEDAMRYLDKQREYYQKTGKRGQIDILKTRKSQLELELNDAQLEYQDLNAKKVYLEGLYVEQQSLLDNRIAYLHAIEINAEEDSKVKVEEQMRDLLKNQRELEQIKTDIRNINVEINLLKTEISKFDKEIESKTLMRKLYPDYLEKVNHTKMIMGKRDQIAKQPKSYIKEPPHLFFDLINDKKVRLNQLKEEKQSISVKRELISQERSAYSPPSRIKPTMLILAFVFLVLFVGVVVLKPFIPVDYYRILFAFASGGFVACVVIYFKKLATYSNIKAEYFNLTESSSLEESLLLSREKKLAEEITKQKDEIIEDCQVYGIYSNGDDVESIIIRITQEINNSKQYFAELDELQKKYIEFSNTVNVEELEICQNYSNQDDNQSIIDRRKSYEKLNLKEIERAKLSEREKTLSSTLCSMEELNQKWKETINRLTQLNESYQVDDLLEIENLSEKVEEIDVKLKNINNEIVKTSTEIKSLGQRLPDIAEYNEKIKALSDEINEGEIALKCILTAKKCIENANLSLKSNFLPVMRQHFENYLKLLLKSDITVNLSADLELNVFDNGVSRVIDFYSQGTKELIFFAMRLSLMTSLYGKKLPFLLIDDSFVNLDINRYSAVISFLKELSKDTQIVYLTCYRTI